MSGRMMLRHLRVVFACIACSMVACTVASTVACTTEAARGGVRAREDAPVPRTTLARQPIPAGIDPRMVDWRSDGVLVPSQDSLRATPGYVVDSVFPPEEALRRFRAEVGGTPPLTLVGGAPSIDALLRRYWALLAARDTLAMTPLVMSAREFAWLYYPESREAERGLAPNVSWLLLSANSGRGLARALALRSASTSTLSLVGTVCTPQVIVAGANTLHGPCAIIRRSASHTDTVWVARHILQRGRVYKLLSFADAL